MTNLGGKRVNEPCGRHKRRRAGTHSLPACRSARWTPCLPPEITSWLAVPPNFNTNTRCICSQQKTPHTSQSQQRKATQGLVGRHSAGEKRTRQKTSSAHLFWLLSFFVDSCMENTQLSKLLVVTKRAREPNDGWHSDTFFQGAEGVGALVPTPKKLKAVAARVVPHGGEEKTKVTFPPHSSLFCKDKCWLSSVAPSFYLQRFANLDSPSHPFHSCRPIASRRLFLGEHAPIAARFQAEDGLGVTVSDGRTISFKIQRSHWNILIISTRLKPEGSNQQPSGYIDTSGIYI